MTAATDTASLYAPVRDLDWDDLPAVFAASDTLLTTIDEDRDLLRELVDNALSTPELTALCEHYDILDKIVVHDDPTGWRLRLHVFLPGYFDRPHNHRWTYVTRLLASSYVHTLYGTEDQFGAGDDIDTAGLHPRSVRVEAAGDTYALHHSMIHSVVAEPYATSLVVRGPAVKDRFVVTDRHTGKAWWQHGAATEDPAAAAAKRMSPERASACRQQLLDADVLR